MAEGFQRKIDTIVSSIVSAKKENNKIIVSESDLFENITTSISGLNDTGKLLVLEDLNKEANEKPSELLTTTGTISVNRLNEIVNAKIEIAKREGISLRAGEPVSKNNKLTLVEGTLALVAVNAMLNNFDILTPEQRTILRENYDSLDSEQRRKYDKGMLDKIENSNLDDKTKKDLQDFFEGDFHSCINKVLDILQKKYGTNNFKLSNIEQREILQIIEGLDIPDELKKELKKYDFEKWFSIDQSEQQLADWQLQRDQCIENGNLEEVRRLDELIKQKKSSPEHQNYLKAKQASKENEKQIQEATSQSPSQNDETLKNNAQNVSQVADNEIADKLTEDIDVQQTISQEIEQIPFALAKAKFSSEQIKDALDKYTFVFKSLDEADINEMKNLDKNQLRISMKMIFSKVGMDEQIAEILSQITYNNKLVDILENENRKEKFLEEFEAMTNKSIAIQEKTQLKGELSEIFTSYFEQNAVDMNVAVIEKTEEQENKQQVVTDEHTKEVNEKQTTLPKQEQIANEKDYIQVDASTSDSSNNTTPTTDDLVEETPIEEQPVQNQNEQLPAINNGSFVSRVKRFFNGMKKTENNKKGFFGRLSSSFKNAFWIIQNIKCKKMKQQIYLKKVKLFREQMIYSKL